MRKILVCDEDKDIGEITARALENYGFKAIYLSDKDLLWSNGKVERMLRKEVPTFAILDGSSTITSLGICCKIKRISPNTTTIILTNDSTNYCFEYHPESGGCQFFKREDGLKKLVEYINS